MTRWWFGLVPSRQFLTHGGGKAMAAKNEPLHWFYGSRDANYGFTSQLRAYKLFSAPKLQPYTQGPENKSFFAKKSKTIIRRRNGILLFKVQFKAGFWLQFHFTHE